MIRYGLLVSVISLVIYIARAVDFINYFRLPQNRLFHFHPKTLPFQLRCNIDFCIGLHFSTTEQTLY